jgi:hypothetical protein
MVAWCSLEPQVSSAKRAASRFACTWLHVPLSAVRHLSLFSLLWINIPDRDRVDLSESLMTGSMLHATIFSLYLCHANEDFSSC